MKLPEPKETSSDSPKRMVVRRLFRMFKEFTGSSAGSKGMMMFTALFFFLVVINALNVFNSYVGRDFMTAIENKSREGFVRYGWQWVGVFGLSTVAAVLYKFLEDRLGLLWRNWFTRRTVTQYMDDRVYLRVEQAGVLENPDQRIAEDIRTLTGNSLSFMLMFLNSGFTILAFTGVIWSISPMLLAGAVGYAMMGSLLTIFLGRSLIGLNSKQLDSEARFRADLIHVRDHADLLAILHREGRLKRRILRSLDALVQNMKRVIAVTRNLGFFTTGYNYLIQIIPALIIAPLFIRGETEFGTITQAAIAFTHLVNAFSLIVTQFPQISNFAAVVGRLAILTKAFDEAHACPPTSIKVVEQDDEVAFDHLTLYEREHGRELVRDLTAHIPIGTRVLIHGPNKHAASALFRATAGLRNNGEGTIIRPAKEVLMFLPEKPYLSPGSLREMLLRTGQEDSMPDERIMKVVNALDLDEVVTRVGGLDMEHESWDSLLSLGEQKSLVVARLVLAGPKFAFLDAVHTALTEEQVERVRNLLCDSSITYLNIGQLDQELNLGCYDAALTINNDGSWLWQAVVDGQLSDLPPTAATK